ncbi:MAG: phosphatidylglycerophosphatase A [Alicyclobacillus macrosporangiidus]|uniref:phosphatidylglycerophosphatase A family protein n=1 Tax=Alicyclobacillus macrosporangiidus TaxID=392015 RepID=UPI0026F27B64|nr:phosphatidylglycerophosphatase A [Alicyclobacillus macrosporangiidus]MCL6599667.1 phosphatidylglycerophosphatase A [Alicyclobacillus macrosporangiidus]
MPSSIRSQQLHQATLKALEERGVHIRDIAEIVYFLQRDYVPGLTPEMCMPHVEKVLEKREVQHAILTGVELDKLAERGALSWPLQQVIETDESLYGIDEILALSILNIYGSIGYTNYGYIDKVKHGILHRLNDKSAGEVHTFLDDLVAAVAAAAASRIAHHHRAIEESGDAGDEAAFEDPVTQTAAVNTDGEQE